MRNLFYLCVCALLLFIAGCERGCTIQNTLERETRDYTINGETVTVDVLLIDNRNSRAINQNIFRRKVTHTYSINIDVHYRGTDIGDVFVEGIDNPDKADLSKTMKRVSVSLSRDGNHLAIGVDQKIAEVFHFYKGHLIETENLQALNPAKGTAWSQLRIEDFPTPRELILSNLTAECEYYFGDHELVKTFMDDLAPSDTAHRNLLANWPQCQLAMEYYSAANVKRLKANKTWNQWAELRSMEVLRKDVRAVGFTETEDFYAALGSQRVQDVQDSTMISNWGGKGDQSYNDMLVNRLKSKSGLSPENRQIIYTQAKSGVATFLREGSSDYRREANYCLRVLSAMGDTTEAEKVIRLALGPNGARLRVFDMIETVFENYSYYTPTQQEFIRSKAEEVFARIPDYARSIMFSASVAIVDCSQLRVWKKNYAKDLPNNELPKGC